MHRCMPSTCSLPLAPSHGGWPPSLALQSLSSPRTSNSCWPRPRQALMWCCAPSFVQTGSGPHCSLLLGTLEESMSDCHKHCMTSRTAVHIQHAVVLLECQTCVACSIAHGRPCASKHCTDMHELCPAGAHSAASDGARPTRMMTTCACMSAVATAASRQAAGTHCCSLLLALTPTSWWMRQWQKQQPCQVSKEYEQPWEHHAL